MTRESLHVGRRVLGREHFAFFRGVLEGLTPELLWDRFLGLEGEYSAPLADATVQWIRQELITLAREHRPDLVGVLRRDPRRMKRPPLPSVDELAQDLSDPDFYSQAELQALWHEQYGHRDGRSAERRQKLQERLRSALQALEASYTKAPALLHPVAQWLMPALTQRLRAAGVATLADLVALRRAGGARWWTRVDRLGEVGATRLGRWLDETFPEAVGSPSPAEIHGIVPLERWTAAQPLEPIHAPLSDTTAPSTPSPDSTPTVPVSDGAPGGINPRLLEAKNDDAAIKLWLATRATNPNTLRGYRREAERLLLWCGRERGRGLRELTVEDCVAYRGWLAQLGTVDEARWVASGWRVPQAAWIGPRHVERHDAAWRPFEGALSPSSRAQAVITVSALFRFLVKGGYIAHSPWDMLGKPVQEAPLGDAADVDAEHGLDGDDDLDEKSLTAEEWRFLLDQARRAEGVLARRTELVLWLGFGCGLRASEMGALTLGRLRVDDARGWRMKVRGKGSKLRTIPLAKPAVRALIAYAAACGVDETQLRGLIAQKAALPVLRNHSNRLRKRAGLGGGASSAGVVGAAGATSPSAASPFAQATALPFSATARGLPAEVAPQVAGVGYTGLRSALGAFFKRCADSLAEIDVAGALRLQAATTHWLRHTFATLMLASGAQLPEVQKLLGHSNIATTGKYVRAHRRRMQEAVEKFSAELDLPP